MIGNFEVGKEFDALLIEPQVNRSKFIVVSNFDSVQVSVSRCRRSCSSSCSQARRRMGRDKFSSEPATFGGPDVAKNIKYTRVRYFKK